MEEERYMKRALELALRGRGHTAPNPVVGAVIVKDGRIIGEGWHEKFGGAHAERKALANCTESPKGADLYVTLEPCCHWGKTPPCTDAIIESGIRRVFVGSLDRNPLVRGKSRSILETQGISVTEGILEKECDMANEVFFHYIVHKTPFVYMKYAMTMDGKIACANGLSKWVTGGLAREKVAKDRSLAAGIMVGLGTVLADDPLLTSRIPGGKNPKRIICDTRLTTPKNARVVRTTDQAETIIATSNGDREAWEPYEAAGCRIVWIPQKEGHVDLRKLMKWLGTEGIDSLILEGGGQLNASALEAGIVHKVQVYIAPKIFGGTEAKTPVAGSGVFSPDQAWRLAAPQITRLGEDLLLESEVLLCSQGS